jgi:3-deoxy-D-manno-octulosonic-acid transferase
MGQSSIKRPSGSLLWIHAASVGEAQSTLILIEELLKRSENLNFLVTTGTKTSAELLEKRLPEQAIHQYYPLDSPKWTKNFLNHWQPDCIIWMESELWPNMLMQVAALDIPCALVNARLSEKSVNRWLKQPKFISRLLNCFSVILAQTLNDEVNFKRLGARNVHVTDNLKYCAAPLPVIQQSLDDFNKALEGRKVWLYASTHEGEESLACRLHKRLKIDFPDLLTVIVPRHPNRSYDISEICSNHELSFTLRGEQRALPQSNDDIYIANTIGELGLFYRACNIVCIGRTFSKDGGGGHNPIESAQLDCAILHGPHFQNLARIFEEMDGYGASICVKSEEKFEETLRKILDDEETLTILQNKASQFANNKSRILERIMNQIDPLLKKARIIKENKKCA